MSIEHRADLIVAGGGTGGHFFCGLALAEKFLEKNPQARVCFVGVKKGIEGRVQLEDPRMRVLFIPASGFKNTGLSAKVESLALLAIGFFKMFFHLIKMKPKVVLGVGGYTSASTLSAAYLLRPILGFGLRVVDQNSSPGMVNKIFSKLGVDSYSLFASEGFKRIELPVRAKIAEKVKTTEPASWPPQRILIMGGSQGAKGLNSAWIKLLPELHQHFSNLKFTHQTGALSLEVVRAAYDDLQIDATCFEYSDNLQDYIAEADLVVSRAGALSILELAAFERPSVFIPFPGAADDHQLKNALAVQHSDWIISENQLSWLQFEKVLSSPKPRAPQFRDKSRYTWRQIF